MMHYTIANVPYITIALNCTLHLYWSALTCINGVSARRVIVYFYHTTSLHYRPIPYHAMGIYHIAMPQQYS